MNHGLEKKIAIGLAMTIAIIVLVSYYWITESSRQQAAEALFQQQAFERAAQHQATACTMCHGIQGRGGFGPSLRESTLDEEGMINVISKGRGAMAPFLKEKGGLFTAAEIRDLVTFIRNWDEALWQKSWDRSLDFYSGATPIPPPDEFKGKKNPFNWDDPAVQAAGKAIYTLQPCLQCHGEKGDGKGPLGVILDPAPADFTNPGRHRRLESDSDFFLWRVAEGFQSTAMPPFKSILSEEQMWQVLTYEWSLGK